MKSLQQDFSQLTGVFNQLSDIHGTCRIDRLSGFPSAALVPLDNDKIFF
jgi:hypothetical protein